MKERIIDTGRTVEAMGFAALADQLAGGSEDRARALTAANDRASRDLSAVLDALGRVRECSDEVDTLDRAARELCGVELFDRVMVSRVSGSTWFPLALYAAAGDGRVSLDLDDSGAGVDNLRIALVSPLIEAEVVRRRLPAVVADADHEPRTHRPLVERTGTKDYVVAPVVACGSVIGLLHADLPFGQRPLTELDRDLLRMFADGVGLVYEVADLAWRQEQQRRAVAEACEAAVRTVDDLGFSGVARMSPSPDGMSPDRPSIPVLGAVRGNASQPRPGARLARLTARELEVVALLASGATNAQLADQLTVAESTVKSHVKHILHKLGATNRASAIACYLKETRDDEGRPR
ncbi:LuxR C-terminal-related transcriptional regulator [Mycolicibacterium pyrenivorans]|uniref:LuxR C-terminal-related transcriptional regulator n=1 Tax=Mycolicibacterium pyrenivorans TaxID=187102 RepID=UPI0021F3182D|nr:LuxR C-terminal-related transcriptional regulator [Mycolicibacterium pyrenivorans]MCV7154898.1 GAF domain-containing protein [Mycolicibacterium pyrenivorans]